MQLLNADYFRYLPVSPRDRDWGLFVTGAGRSDVPPGANYPLNVHPDAYQFGWEKGRVLPDYQAVYIVRGHGEFESRTAGAKAIAPGSMILLFPGEWHRYRPDRESGWEEYWLSFSGPHADEMVQNGFISPAEPVLAVGLDETVLHPYLLTLDHIRSEPIGYQQMIAVKVHEVLVAAISVVRSLRAGRRAETLVREACILFEQAARLPSVSGPVSIEQVAASFSISGKHFRRLFKAQTGLSPHQYYMQMKIHRAKELLRGTNVSIKEVSSALYFENQFHFSNAFKRWTGISPSQWRNGGIR